MQKGFVSHGSGTRGLFGSDIFFMVLESTWECLIVVCVIFVLLIFVL